ncbi:glutathione S-transferase T3-like [Eutrema salsugineum]|uniref:glutathione S-transferase T3-like n=1 Tax=Eutrema salsugineum TaxID=72664 RepID=UPI000CED477A|nr:glutathione S-transferase T3-like [Eutrema salsugineum]
MSSPFPFSNTSNFVDLLQSQQESVSPYPNPYPSFENHAFGTQASTKEVEEVGVTSKVIRRPWSPAEDTLLISSWLNTSKDPVVGNEQKSGTFWSRIALYFAANHKGGEIRESGHCKQRWHKINDLVSKFCGAYEAATRERTSVQNENDILKNAHAIFFNLHKKKFTLEYAWKELKNDQKWCDLSTSKTDGRPPGVKAAKAKGKKMDVVEAVNVFGNMWNMKKEEMTMKKETQKMALLDSLIAKGHLSKTEEALKGKLISELLHNE